MPRNPRKKNKLARKQADRINGMRRKRDGDDRDEHGNGGQNGDNIQLKDNNSQREERYRM